MSTVVLTPTHIGSDHNIVHQNYPHETAPLLDYPKIFVSPKKQYLIGAVGAYSAEAVDTPATWEMFAKLIHRILTDLALFGLLGSETAIEDEEITDRYLNVFDRRGHVFLVTKRYRFVLAWSEMFKYIKVKQVGDYAGIGSGGMIAAGLAMHDPSLSKIWPRLNALDRLSSVEHTVIPLKLLKHNARADRIIQKARAEVVKGNADS